MNKIIAFVLGAGVGAGAMAYICRTKYEVMIQEELNNIKSAYKEKLKDAGIVDSHADEDDEQNITDEDNVMQYANKLSKKEHTNYSSMSAKKEEEEIPKNVVIEEELDVAKQKIHVISPDDFGDDTSYATISLTLYLDGIVTDEDDDPISHVEDIIGDALEHFGEYEEDSVFIRNDANHTYYEVLRDERNYSEV